ncbi:chitobiase/beta-hexosaminidase C-terminal domain-containing protein [Acidicapsa ligni]|uniref:chitobiase/beta-hexosaminidase C-terminal domain-containing protein n=1 Tax=Acidicapsa ligni TaxID=542300 RepID=UPI0021E03AD4|nr:chitobiase/beta-hexosaminidase C-terminal domain-containing protein [Acidicapsa ligni]
MIAILFATLAVQNGNAQTNVTTYHNDIGRTGQNQTETILNTSNVNATSFGKLFSQPVDGLIYAQPLYLHAITVKGATHNVVFVATEHDSVYAFDADSNVGTDASPLWHDALLSTAFGAASGATTVPSTVVGSDISPEVGITGTPVIDPSTGTLYVVSKTYESSVAVQRLHALDVTTGAEKFGGPVVLTATIPGTGNGSVNGSLTFDPLWENQRPGLLLLNGIVYIGFAAHGDNGPWHGWILGYNATNLKQTGAFNASPNGTGSGFWMSGEGLAADQLDPVNKPFGRMFVPTGNGDYDAVKPYTTSMDFGDSHLNLDLTNGSPTVTDEFTTNQQASLNAEDGDIASGGMIVIPTQTTGSTPHLAVQAGKGGTLYLLNRDNMGGYNLTTDQAVQEQAYSVGNVGVWSTPAYFNGAVYYWGRFDYLKSFPLINGLLSTTPTKSAEQYGYPGATPSISANGTSQGIVWSIDSENYPNNGAAILQAHDASNVASMLYSSSTNSARDAGGPAVKFTVPTIADGMVFVGAAGEVDFYGLLNGVTQTDSPSITPGTESYNGTISVTITDGSPNAIIYYTTDGSAATTSSPVYTGPISVNTTETIHAIASSSGLLLSAQSSVTYTNVSQTSAVIFSAPTGSYSSAQTVKLTDATVNSVIYYTTNGSTPTTASTVYSSPIVVSSTETITAFAVATGLGPSPTLAQTYTIQNGAGGIDFSQGFAASSGLIVLNGSAALNDSRLQLTNGLTGEAGSAFYHSAVNIQAFTSDFTMQLSNPVANGMTFTIENAPQNVNAIGGNGSGLGYSTITNSLAIKFDFYNSAGEGNDSTGLYLNGALPTVPSIDLSATGINLQSDDNMAVHFVYNGTVLTMTITDMVTAASWTTSWTINIPSTIGGNTAYVGFTGGTGGFSASQKVLTWTFASGTPTATTATPTFSVAPGTYTSAQTVSIADSTTGATIYYTTNGTTPTTSSTVYSTPVTVSSTETLQAIATSTGNSTSAVASAAYTISVAATATPTFSPAAGTYVSAQTVSIADSTTGAAIYYTTNGTMPTTSSTLYSAPIMVSTTETLNAIAVATGHSNSTIGSAAYTITTTTATPTFSPAAGTYASAQTVSIADSTTGAAIYYTTNGTMPTTSSTLYSAPIMVSTTETLNAIAVATGHSNSTVGSAAYTINTSGQTTAPIFNIQGGTFNAVQTITITDATPGATIYYAINSAPTTKSAKYTGPVPVRNSASLQALAIAPGQTTSNITSQTYTYITGAPVISPSGGTFNGPQTVTITSASPNALIFYSTNGLQPNANGTRYTVPITVSASEKIIAMATETGFTQSAFVTAVFTISNVAATPTFAVAGGTYATAQSVAISDTTPGAAIHYTTNGSTPTASSAAYTAPITVSATETLQAIAIASGYATSSVGTATYTIAPLAATPTFTPVAGTYSTSQTVTLHDATSGATIYYTTDGTTPTASSAVYSTPISVSASKTLKALAIASGFSNSATASAIYTIQNQTPATSINLASGFASAGAKVVMNGTAALSGVMAQLTNGGSAQAGSAWYAAPMNVTAFTTDFTFQQVNASADGMTFAIENSPSNVNSLGGNGASLGYGGITNSVAIKFDLYNNAGEGADSTGLYQNGAAPTTPSIDLSSTGINLHSGDVMAVHIVYNGTTLTMTITDQTTAATYTNSWPINIPTVVGANTAYVGFTGGTGGLSATQNVLTWTYNSN